MERASALSDAPLQAACLTAREPAKLFRRIKADDGKAAWRRQFALALPGLSELALEPRVAQAIDAGEEALPAVARAMYVGLPVARRLVGRWDMPYPGRGSSARDDAEELGRLLDLIGHDRLPRDEDGWADMVHCVRAGLHALSWSDSYRGPALGHVARLVLGIPGRDWSARRDALMRAEVSDREINDAQDMAAAYQGLLNAIDPRVPLNGVDHIGLGLMAGHASLVRYVEASRRWHLDPVLARSDGRVAPDASWPAPFGRVEMEGGWSVTCLAAAGDLVAEGCVGKDADGMDGLAHCVGIYAGSCQSGHSLILSVRHAAAGVERRVATAELVADASPRGEPYDVGGRPFRLRQYRGPGNAAAPPEAVEVLARFREALNRGGVEVDPAAVAPRQASPHMPRRRAAQVAYARERLDLWRPYLPRTLRGLSAEEQARAAAALVAAAPRDSLKAPRPLE